MRSSNPVPRRRLALAALAVMLGAASASAAVPTEAAWTDRVVASGEASSATRSRIAELAAVASRGTAELLVDPTPGGDAFVLTPQRLWRVAAHGGASVVVGYAHPVQTGTCVPAVAGAVYLDYAPYGSWFEEGVVYAADDNCSIIWRIDTATREATILAGASGELGHADGIGGAARFYGPAWLAADPVAGQLWATEWIPPNGYRVRRIDPSNGAVTTVSIPQSLCPGPDVGIEQLEFTADGRMYGVVKTPNHECMRPVWIDRTTMALSPIPIPDDADWWTVLDSSDGRAWFFVQSSQYTSCRIIAVAPTNDASTVFGVHGAPCAWPPSGTEMTASTPIGLAYDAVVAPDGRAWFSLDGRGGTLVYRVAPEW